MRLVLIFLLAVFSLNGLDAASKTKKVYGFTDQPIDVIIPSVDKDLATLERCIEGIRENCDQIRRIIVVSSKKLTDLAEWYDEKNYPFNKADVGLYLLKGDAKKADDYVSKRGSRVGWYYQQLLKLYAPYVIEGISSNVLILDSDTIFLTPVSFLNDSYGACFNVGKEYHKTYFGHASRLTGGAVKRLNASQSGVTHHMLFQTDILDDLFDLVESVHGKELWKAFCECVDLKDLEKSGASEYEIYFNYALAKTNEVSIRSLKWGNIPSLNEIQSYKEKGFNYVSCHSWCRLENE